MAKRSISDKYIQEDKFLNNLAEGFRLQESILNATDLAIFSFNPEGLITRFNHAAERLLGYSAEEVIDKITPAVFYDSKQVSKRSKELSQELGKSIDPSLEVFIAKAKNQKEVDRNEWTLIRKDGTPFPALVSIAPLLDDDASIFGYACIITDYTEQQKIKDLIFASEEKFRLLADNIPGAIYLSYNDSEHSIIYLNDHIEEITGYPAKSFIAGDNTLASLFHPEDKEMVFDTVNRALAERRSFQMRYRLKHRSGEWRWVDEVGAGVYVNDQLTMLEGFLSDITLQKEAEEKLQKVAEENLRVFNNPVTLNAIADFAGYFKRISPSWTKFLEWSDQELKSKPFIDFIHLEDIHSTREAIQYITEGNKVITFENRYQCKDGTYRWLLWGAASDLNMKMIYASAIDITARKKSEEHILNSKTSLETLAHKLQEQNRQLDEFAHIISHNLRAPVNNIQALINLLDENSAITDYKLIFDKLKNVAKNLSETMNELMDTLKVKTTPKIDLTEIRFKELLDKVVQSLEGELIVAQASVTFDFNQAPAIHYSKPYLESIFQNLLTNAIKYRSPKRKPLIHFQSSLVNNHIELRVIDNGLGIDMDRFGDKLFGLHKTFHEHKEARGVGLFLIKTQIEAMGGNITAESKVDKGTTFIIRFVQKLTVDN